MATYYGNINVFSLAMEYKLGPLSASLLESNGNVMSNDLQIARSLSEGLVENLEKSNEIVYKIHRRL